MRTLVHFVRPCMELSEGRFASISAITYFDSIKRSITERPGSFHFNPATFFRAGTTRNWEQHLSTEDVRRIDRKTRVVWGEDPTCPDLSGLRTLSTTR